MNPKSAVLLIAHGSPRNEANEFVIDLCLKIQARSGQRVAPAFLTGKPTSIETAFDLLAGEGVQAIHILPFFLVPGDHTQQDIPHQIATLRQKWPDIQISLSQPIGMHPLLIDLIVSEIAVKKA